ncbi:SMP-30/gluconolactonase/LRE family protein [Mycobacterium sp. CVI_P3]|uniref:SMP-30/gluconolactonase/LRE family protein n=1 Tax=Mycobacterium pinniadriaticum TaxID=2994102 RepID=A0ABT3SHZ9_9MYCO|nr:SMP-30/gluconolactonase/LRE family protein [Mycobacterium pinniadriaticum]MCX2932404.1 SMP-30/gluconolactonase/LRE family protein [Mycobacterium pinniadriaticum]MCX2938739.1 SMP-30/gluconolactonase/LRE family protein [Mycobacterium pinniadriaticum]
MRGSIAHPWVLTPLADGLSAAQSLRWFEGLLWFPSSLEEAVHTVDIRGSMTTLPLPGHRPTGLAFRPDGSLLIASSNKRRILRYDGEVVTTFVDLSDTAPGPLGDMVVDRAGRTYILCPATEDGVLVQIDRGNNVTISAAGLDDPVGIVVTLDGRTLIVAESLGRRLTAFSIAPDGSLSGRRPFAEGLSGPPGGISIDAHGGIWTATTLAHQFQRVVAGGAVTDRIDMGDRSAIGCTLGGPSGRTLFMLSTPDCSCSIAAGRNSCRIDTVVVDIPGVPRR